MTTSTTALATPVDVWPTPNMRREVSLTRRIVANLSASSTPVTRDTAPALLTAATKTVLEDGRRPRSRTTPVRAEGFAARYVWDFYPGNWHYYGHRLRTDVRQLPPGRVRRLQERFSPTDPRLSWLDDDGRLVIDELHATDLAGALLCNWMRERLNADRHLGLHRAAERFVGVRLLSLRHPHTSLLITPDGERQLLADTPLDAEGGVWR